MDPKAKPPSSGNDNNAAAAAEPLLAPIRREPFQSPDSVMSASLDNRIKGFLSVRVTFLGEPVKDLSVQFFRLDGSKVNPVTPEQMEFLNTSITVLDNYKAIELTNDDGWYGLPFPVPVDSYFCDIEHQPRILITTVEVAAKPFALVLPIGRPYHDFYLDTFPDPPAAPK